MDGDNKNVPHSDLTPDQAVSLRPASQGPAPSGMSPNPTTPQSSVAPEPLTNFGGVPTGLSAPAATADPVDDHLYNSGESQREPIPAPLSADGSQPAETEVPDVLELAWESPEFIAHAKSMQWYMALAGISVAAIVIVFLLSGDWIAVITIAVCAGLFGYAAGRQPRHMQYGLTRKGVLIGNKGYLYKDFRSYAVVPEGPITGIDLTPLKRFQPMLSITCLPENQSQVIETLSKHLAVSAHHHTAVDSLMQRIRF